MNMLQQHRPSRQPLQQIDQNPQEQSYRQVTPQHKGPQKMLTNGSDFKQLLNYNHQFKVGQGQDKQPQHTQQIENIQMMSPNQPRREAQLQVTRSPLQKNYSQNHILQSPINKVPLKAFRGQSQNTISYTTTDTLQQDITAIREQNNILQQQINQLESIIYRGSQSQFMKELEQKIQMLSQLNEKLRQDNLKLSEILNIDVLKQQLVEQIKNKTKMEEDYEQLLSEFDKWDCAELEQQLESDDTGAITQLIQDLESKVHGLIVENEELNDKINQNSISNDDTNRLEIEVKQLQTQIQRMKLEESQLKNKWDILNAELKSKSKCNNENKSVKLKEQITMLLKQNESLAAMTQCNNYEEEISDLEDRIHVIGNDNRKLETKLLQLRQ